MKKTNSVGGHRIYPSSPEVAERVAQGESIIGFFRESMDHLNRHRELSGSQRDFLENLPAESPLAREYARVSQLSDSWWAIALEKQQTLNQLQFGGPYSTREIGERLFACSHLWERLKRNVDDAMQA